MESMVSMAIVPVVISVAAPLYQKAVLRAREGYLRRMPLDPIAGNSTSWRIIMEDASASTSQSEPGDIRRAKFIGKNQFGRHAV